MTPRLGKRILAVTASATIGMVGALALASPASAHHPIVEGSSICHETGEWIVIWTVTNSENDLDGEITEVSVDPAVDLETIVEGATLPKDGGITESYRLPGDTTSASLDVTVKWNRNGRTIVEDGSERIELGGPCEPADDLPVEQSMDCDSLTVNVTNHREGKDASSFEARVTDGDRTVVLTVEPGETKAVTFDAAEGTLVTVEIGEGGWEIPWEQPEGCDEEPEPEPEGEGEGGGDEELPVTGAQSALIAGGALLLLTVGGAMYFVARRRRITFTA